MHGIRISLRELALDRLQQRRSASDASTIAAGGTGKWLTIDPLRMTTAAESSRLR
jgi:hypothetical protein